MAYTTHGHLIPNSIATAGPRGSVYRCGGPTICKKCAIEVAQYLTEQTKTEDDIPGPKHEVPGLTIRKFTRNPFEVDAVQVTEDNFEQVAAWCGGSIVTVHEVREENALIELPPKRYISVPVTRPMNKRQTEAYLGSWVVWADRGFKVYGNRPFTKSFSEKLEELLVTTESV